MAKKSMLEREKKREIAVQKYAAKRRALKEAGDYEALSKLPRNASPTPMLMTIFSSFGISISFV